MSNLQTATNYMVGLGFLGEEAQWAQGVTVPGFNFMIPEYGGRSGVRTLFGPDSVTYDALVIDLILDENLTVYRKLLTYVKSRIRTEDNTFEFEPFEAWIEFLNPFGGGNLKIEYHDCLLESVSAIDMTVTEDSEVTINLTIRFNSFDLIGPEGSEGSKPNLVPVVD